MYVCVCKCIHALTHSVYVWNCLHIRICVCMSIFTFHSIYRYVDICISVRVDIRR